MADFDKPVPREYAQKLRDGIRNNQPEFFGLVNKAEEGWATKSSRVIVPYTGVVFSDPIPQKWLYPWSAKQVYALWYEHAKETLPDTAVVTLRWFANADLYSGKLPKETVETLSKLNCLKSKSRTSSDEYIYKYDLYPTIGLGLFSILIHRSCVIYAIVEKDGSTIPNKANWPQFSTNARDGIHPWAADKQEPLDAVEVLQQ